MVGNGTLLLACDGHPTNNCVYSLIWWGDFQPTKKHRKMALIRFSEDNCASNWHCISEFGLSRRKISTRVSEHGNFKLRNFYLKTIGKRSFGDTQKLTVVDGPVLTTASPWTDRKWITQRPGARSNQRKPLHVQSDGVCPAGGFVSSHLCHEIMKVSGLRVLILLDWTDKLFGLGKMSLSEEKHRVNSYYRIRAVSLIKLCSDDPLVSFWV